MTNGEAIRASNESLASYLAHSVDCDGCPLYGRCPGFNVACYEKWLEYFNKEAK